MPKSYLFSYSKRYNVSKSRAHISGLKPKNWVVDLDVLEKAIVEHKPKAFISVDIYGQSCDYETILNLCNQYNVILIEDAAEALGSTYKNKKCGSFGQMGIFSFNGNKIITTSGGGMLVSNNEDYAKKARFLSTQAREPEIHYEHKELGYNYRMSNLLAAVGRGQLELIDDRVSKRISIFNHYEESLSHVDGFTFMKEGDSCKSNRWLTTLTVDDKISGISRNQIIEFLEKENIESDQFGNRCICSIFIKSLIILKVTVKMSLQNYFRMVYVYLLGLTYSKNNKIELLT